MKKITLFFFLLVNILSVDVAHSQNFTLGLRGGISIPNLTAGGAEKNPLNKGYSSRFGPDFAIFGQYKISDLFSIEPMIEYSSQGGKKNGLQAFPNPMGSTPPYLYANFKSEAKLNYILVPILAKFSWSLSTGSRVKLFADAGPFAGFLLSAHQVTSGSSIIYADPQGTIPTSPTAQPFDANDNIRDQLNTFNFGVSGNLGFAYHFSKSNVFIEGGGNYGFLNIQKGTANGKNQTGAGTIAVGYGYSF